MKLARQDSSRTALLGVGTAAAGLISYLVGKWTGDRELAGVVATFLIATSAALANYASPLAERGAKDESRAIATEAAQQVAADTAQQVATDTAAQVAANTASAVATEKPESE